MLRRQRFDRPAPRPLRGSAWPLCLVLLAGSGCTDPLSVANPDAAQPADLGSAAGLAALRAGTFGDFAKAYGGDATASDAEETQILATGMFADEFKNTETDPERIAYDARRIDPKGTGQHLGNFYAVLHRARAAAEAASLAYQQAAPSDADAVIAEIAISPCILLDPLAPKCGLSVEKRMGSAALGDL